MDLSSDHNGLKSMFFLLLFCFGVVFGLGGCLDVGPASPANSFAAKKLEQDSAARGSPISWRKIELIVIRQAGRARLLAAIQACAHAR